jgi:hypothetical protein
MAKPDENARKSPAQQTGEEHGSVKKAQRSERDMVDLARGSEVETRAAAQHRN